MKDPDEILPLMGSFTIGAAPKSTSTSVRSSRRQSATNTRPSIGSVTTSKQDRLKRIAKARRGVKRSSVWRNREGRRDLDLSGLQEGKSNAEKLECVRIIRLAYATHAAEDDELSDFVLSAVPQLVRLMADSPGELQVEAITALANIGGCSPILAEVIVESGSLELAAAILTKAAQGFDIKVAVPTEIDTEAGTGARVFQLLAVSSADLLAVERAITLLGYVAGTSVVFRDVIAALNILRPLAILAKEAPTESIARECMGTLRRVCCGDPPPPPAEYALVAEVAVSALALEREEMVADALAIVTSTNVLEALTAPVILEYCPRIVALVLHTLPDVRVHAVRLVDSLVMHEILGKALLQNRLLPALRVVLANTHHPEILREACAPLATVATMGRDAKDALVEAGMMGGLVSLLEHTDSEVQRVALATLTGFVVGGTEEHLATLVQAQGIKAVCRLLMHREILIVDLALECLRTVLTAEDAGRNGPIATVILDCHGLQTISNLRNSPDAYIADKARDLVSLFFDDSSLELANRFCLSLAL